MPNLPPAVRFGLDDAQRAADEWGANCGPGAVAAICKLTLEELRPHLGDFDRKRYTNPTLMWDILKRLGVRYRCTLNQQSSEHQGMLAFPFFGLARVQWEGPWTEPGVPIRVRYRHTHWVGVCGREIFDINAMVIGGWLPLPEWSLQLVPWLLEQCEPKANRRWHLTHAVEVDRDSVASISRSLQGQGAQIGDLEAKTRGTRSAEGAGGHLGNRGGGGK